MLLLHTHTILMRLRSRAKSLSGDQDLGEETARSRDNFLAGRGGVAPAPPLSKAASRVFGINAGVSELGAGNRVSIW